jgi:hypothetical protein
MCEVESTPYVPSPGWTRYECHCAGGEFEGADGYPKPCWRCKGWGHYWKHAASGVLAVYPGGPFIGREEPTTEEG